MNILWMTQMRLWLRLAMAWVQNLLHRILPRILHPAGLLSMDQHRCPQSQNSKCQFRATRESHCKNMLKNQSRTRVFLQTKIKDLCMATAKSLKNLKIQSRMPLNFSSTMKTACFARVTKSSFMEKEKTSQEISDTLSSNKMTSSETVKMVLSSKIF